ncbi:MAG: VCBS repeat-containing protein, partial [Verrucomicrobiales bacterium]|nr:VCBS repeat-containing protein [Verrucomicrobiales bacterium]
MLLIAATSFRDAEAASVLVPTFTQVSVPVFSTLQPAALAAAWGDADGDGRPDLYLSSLSPGYGQFLRNTTNGFVRVTDGSIFSDFVSRGGPAWGDIDNDGDLDLFVPTLGESPDILYRNRGDGTFDKVSVLEPINGIGLGCALADYNNDGLLDVLVANGGGSFQQPIFLYRNLGGSLLTNLSSIPLADDLRNFQGLALSDYDLDGDPDLVGANNGGASLFYENIAFSGFEERTNGVFGTRDTETSTATLAWGDYDNDGDSDLLLVTGLGPIRLYRNEAGHQLRAVTNEPLTLGGASFVGTAGGAWADFNNDGWLDVLISRRSGSPLLYLADGLGSFLPPTNSPAFGAVLGGNGLALADYDLDGDIDILLPNWPQNTPPALFRNNLTNQHWLQVQLRGTLSNRNGIGARVQLRTTVAGQVVVQTREIGLFDSAGSQELLAHFGLGDASAADSLVVFWPNGDVQELAGIPADQRLTITQSANVDTTSVSVRVTDNTASEPGANSAAFDVVRSGSTLIPLTVNLLVAGSATSDVDFSPLPATVLIPIGATSAPVVVSPLDDSEPEPIKSVVLSVAPGSGYLTNGIVAAEVSLFDNDVVSACPPGVLALDGIDDYATVGASVWPTNLFPASFTVEAWIYPRSLSGLRFAAADDAFDLTFASAALNHVLYGPAGLFSSSSLPSGPTLNSWNHLAITFDGTSRQLRAALNGVLSSPVAFPDSGFYSDSVQHFTLGARRLTPKTPPEGLFQGEIDEVRISSSVRYTANFQPQFRFTPDAFTRALYHFDEPQGATSFADASIGSRTLTGLFGAQAAALPSPGTDASGRVAYWRFDENAGASAADASGSGNEGALANGPTWDPSGQVDGCLSFDGVDDTVVIPHSSDLELGKDNTDFSVAFWLNLQQGPTGLWRLLMQKGNGLSS